MASPGSSSHVGAFIASSMRVVERLTRISAEPGPARRGRFAARQPTLLISIGVRGDLAGRVIFEFDPPIVDLFVHSMVAADPKARPTSGQDDEHAVLCEVANMIAGNALAALEKSGYDATITTPQVIGHDDALPDFGAQPVVLIPLQDGHAEIGLCVFIEEPSDPAGARDA
jgi:CheY-specific phosphatase CheX